VAVDGLAVDVLTSGDDLAWGNVAQTVGLGLARGVVSHERSSALCQIHEENRCRFCETTMRNDNATKP
jgi:hypothetical protein